MGCETPRLWIEPERELHDTIKDSFGVVVERATTRGYEVIRFAEDVLAITLLPWQKWLLIHSLELNEDGTFRFRIIVLLVARQNGKSTLMQVLTLWRMYVDEAPLIVGTAQTLSIAEKQWQETVQIAEGVPELKAQIENVGLVNGNKSLRLFDKQEYVVKAATRKGARGLAGDLVLLDELREHQNWDAWASVSKTTMARAGAQIWGASNAGDLQSVVLRYLRALGHRALGFPDGSEGIADGLELLAEIDEDEADERASAIEEAMRSIGLFEWSAAPGSSVWDRDGWAQANPAMGHTIQESTIAAAALEPEAVFRTEVLCQFVAHMAQGPFPAGAWEATTEGIVEREARGVRRDHSRQACYCVSVSWNRQMSYVGLAYWDTEGRIRFQLVARRAGTDWLIPWLTSPDRAVPVEHLTIQSRGAPVSALRDSFEQAGLPVTPQEGSLVAGWFDVFYDYLAMSVDPEAPLVTITHAPQPPVDIAAGSAQMKSRMLDLAGSPHDAAPLAAVVGAVGLLSTNPAPAFRSAYEDHGLMVV